MVEIYSSNLRAFKKSYKSTLQTLASLLFVGAALRFRCILQIWVLFSLLLLSHWFPNESWMCWFHISLNSADEICDLLINLHCMWQMNEWMNEQVRTSTFRSYGGRSSQMWWDSCKGWGAGSTVSNLPLSVSLDPLALTRLAAWATRLSR